MTIVNQPYRGGKRVADVVRSDFVEGFHYGSAVILGPNGTVRDHIGDIDAPIFPRSSNKPMQTVTMVDWGLPFGGPADLAIVSASHRGEPFHIAAARGLLQRNGFTPEALRCPAEAPIDPYARDALVAAGGGPTALTMNCSGKHAGMLATCKAADWKPAEYLDPGHELQQAILGTISEVSGYAVASQGIDGCGAPVFSIPLRGLAQAYQRIVDADPDSPAGLVAEAMRKHPELVSGTRGEDTRLMRAVPGLLCKGGAEGIAALAIPGVGAVAIKIDDGAKRAAIPLAVAALRTLDLPSGVDERELAELATTPLTGGGQRVGEVAARWPG